MIESFHIIILINRKGQDSIPCQALIFQVLFTRILKDLSKDISKKDPRRSSDFHQGMDRMRFRDVSTSETNGHVSATFLLSHFRSFLFPLRFRWRIFSFSFDRVINVSEILPLRTIKVNKGKFTLRSRHYSVLYYSRALHYI